MGEGRRTDERKEKRKERLKEGKDSIILNFYIEVKYQLTSLLFWLQVTEQ